MYVNVKSPLWQEKSLKYIDEISNVTYTMSEKGLMIAFQFLDFCCVKYINGKTTLLTSSQVSWNKSNLLSSRVSWCCKARFPAKGRKRSRDHHFNRWLLMLCHISFNCFMCVSPGGFSREQTLIQELRTGCTQVDTLTGITLTVPTSIDTGGGARCEDLLLLLLLW